MKIKLALAAAVVAALSFVTVQAASGAEDKPAPKAEQKKEEAKPSEADLAIIRAQTPTYPFDTCAVSGEKLGSMGKPMDLVVDGRLVRICCKGCTKAIDKDKDAIFKKLDEGVVAAQKASYPLDTCPISGNKLGDKAKDVVVGMRLVRTCCGDCAAKVQKDSAASLQKVNAAYIEAQKKGYKAKCPVSGEEIVDAGKDVLYGTTLVRLCCGGCEKGFWKDPEAMVKKVKAQNEAK
ncbi:MAG: hypothetical protein RL112_2033 [Planctomycetota bacterium]|jgi:hypothetical protein